MIFTIAQRRIRYDLIGHPDAPVVLLAHSLASDSGMWAEQMPALLSAGHRVLTVDMRGHGGSENAPGPYTLESLAEDFKALLDFLGIDSVNYVGLSIGGMIGQAFALQWPERLKKVVWCDTLPAAIPGHRAVREARADRVRQAGSVEAIADETVDRWLTPDFKSRQIQRWTQIRQTIAATTPDGYLSCSHAIGHFDFVSRLPSCKRPVLVICGSDDSSTPASENRRLSALVADGRYEEIKGARHFPNVEKPEIFNEILLGWL